MVILNTSTSIANAISNPFTFYFIYDGNWCSTNFREMWNKGNSSTAISYTTVKKTIYSPSPSGFVEPQINAFSGFTVDGNRQTNSNNWNYSSIEENDFVFFCNSGKTGGTIKFWALGMRDASSGRPGNGGKVALLNSGNYWTIGVFNDALGYNLYFNRTEYELRPITNWQKSEGLTIRSVKK